MISSLTFSQQASVTGSRIHSSLITKIIKKPTTLQLDFGPISAQLRIVGPKSAAGKRFPSALPCWAVFATRATQPRRTHRLPAGIVLAETFVAAPFLIVASRSACASVDPLLEDVAATLGRGRLATFINVSLPLAWLAIRAGLLPAWLRAFGEFGATVMVAYHPYSLPVYMYVAFGSQGLP